MPSNYSYDQSENPDELERILADEGEDDDEE